MKTLLFFAALATVVIAVVSSMPKSRQLPYSNPSLVPHAPLFRSYVKPAHKRQHYNAGDNFGNYGANFGNQYPVGAYQEVNQYNRNNRDNEVYFYYPEDAYDTYYDYIYDYVYPGAYSNYAYAYAKP